MSQALESEGIKGEKEKIGIGAGVGAILGAILGGAKGALAGILIGGGGTIAATEGKDVELPAGTVLRVRLDAPLDAEPVAAGSLSVDQLPSSRIAARAARIVASMSFAVCAADRNHASNCDGGG